MKGQRIRYQQTGEFHFLTFSSFRRQPYPSWSSYRHYQTGIHGTVEIESEGTACERGWQLPAWMRNRQLDSLSLVPKS
jgi:hypothetical protein